MRVAERRTVVDLGDVKAFLAVARAGSFSRAAEELATAKSVVSRRVTRLEGDLGTRLFTRSSKGVVPTEEGEALRVQAGGAFEQLDDALQSAARRTGELTGVLRITAPVAFGTAHLSSFLSDFMREHPRLRIDASFSDRRVDILADGASLGRACQSRLSGAKRYSFAPQRAFGARLHRLWDARRRLVAFSRGRAFYLGADHRAFSVRQSRLHPGCGARWPGNRGTANVYAG
jgi:DNA-binding transcriptional LysR family regulator